MAFAIEKMVASGGNWTPDAGWLKQAAKSDPDIQWRLMSMGETLKQREEKTDFKSYFDSMRDVYSGTSRDPMGDVWRGIQSGSIKGSTIETAMRTAQMMSRPEANVLNNPSVKLVMNRFNDLMTPLGMSILRDPQAVMTALSIFSTEMIEWQSKNPKASPLEVHTKVMDLQKQLDTDGAFGAGFLKKGESGGRGGVTTPTGAQPQGTGQKPPGDVGAVDYRTQPLWHGMDEFMGEYREFMRHRSKQTSFFEQMVRAGVNVRNSNEVLDFFNAQKALLEHPTGN